MKFRALCAFESRELQSGYEPGLTYTVREGDDVLARLLPHWLANGWVEKVDDAATPNVARVGGVGEVN